MVEELLDGDGAIIFSGRLTWNHDTYAHAALTPCERIGDIVSYAAHTRRHAVTPGCATQTRG